MLTGYLITFAVMAGIGIYKNETWEKLRLSRMSLYGGPMLGLIGGSCFLGGRKDPADFIAQCIVMGAAVGIAGFAVLWFTERLSDRVSEPTPARPLTSDALWDKELDGNP